MQNEIAIGRLADGTLISFVSDCAISMLHVHAKEYCAKWTRRNSHDLYVWSAEQSRHFKTTLNGFSRVEIFEYY